MVSTTPQVRQTCAAGTAGAGAGAGRPWACAWAAGGRAQQRGQHGGVGLPAGGQQQRGLGALQARQLGLDLLVQVEIAAHQPRGLRAGAVAGGPFARALDQQRVLGQAQVCLLYTSRCV